MLCVDVNVLVYVANTRCEQNAEARTWLTAALESPEWIAIPDAVAAAYVRIVTDARILSTPLHPDEVFALTDWILEHPRAATLGSDDRTREVFRELVASLGLRGNDIPDAWLAATAKSAGATLVSYDRGFRRFPGLRTLQPG